MSVHINIKRFYFKQMLRHKYSLFLPGNLLSDPTTLTAPGVKSADI